MRCRPPATMLGTALLATVLAVFSLCCASIALGWALQVAPALDPAARKAARLQELQSARDRILAWYAGRLAQLDGAAAFPLQPEEALRQAGVIVPADVRFAAGPLQSGRWAWRPLALWIAPEADASGFADDGSFRADPRARALVRFSSEPLQRAAYATTELSLRTLATDMELAALARLRADPDHDMAVDPFRAADCAAPTSEELPCTQAGQPARVADWLARTTAFGGALRRASDAAPTAQPDALARDAWGGPIVFDNTPDSAAATPHAMRFSATTPAGATIEVVAVQPVE